MGGGRGEIRGKEGEREERRERAGKEKTKPKNQSSKNPGENKK